MPEDQPEHTGTAPYLGPRVTVVAEQLRRRVPGGIGTYATGLLCGLAALQPRPDVSIVASPAPSNRRDPLTEFGFPVSAVGGPFLAGLARSPRWPSAPSQIVTRLWARGMLKLGSERDGRTDLVHSVSLAAPPVGRTPLTVMVHDVAWRQTPESYPPRGLAWHEAALSRTCRTARAVVVPSHAVALDLERAAVELDPSRITVIPEGCDHLPPPDHEAAREALGRLGVTGEYLLSVSTLEPRKNLQRLLDAYRRIRPDLPEPWPLVVVGPAGWGPQLREAPGVVLAGQVPSPVLSALYEAARVVVYVPLVEGFGLPAVEALAAGAPLVVSSGVPCIAELSAPAVVVDPFSVEAIATALALLATDDARRAELAIAGPASVAGQRWSDVARSHLAWWAEVVG
jgi:glycosyltransferase involved in cell wall biosynthesis